MKRIHFEKIHSTHLFAKDSISRLKAFDLSVITCDYQTKGIGRRRDPWIAPSKSSLLVSCVYKAPPKKQIPYISQLCAVSLRDILSSLNLPITFKYPNDLLVHGKKLSGVISEITEGMAITSVGLNILQTKEQVSIIDQPATSLFIETGKKLSSEELLEALLERFFSELTQKR